MSDNGFRIASLNAIAVITIGMVLGGFPLVWVVVREVYGQAPPIALPGDYRAWLMAHLEGLLNGLLLIALAATTRIRPMGAARERTFLWALILAAWGNTVASVIAPVLGVRGMAFDASTANDLVTSLFSVALLATFTAIYIAVRHLLGRRPPA